jgi:hypothetical protein
MSITTTTPTKHEVKPELYVFRHETGKGYRFPEQLSYYPELSNGLESFLSERHYRLLPGLSPALETYESDEAADRFVVTAYYGQIVLVIFLSSTSDYTRLMKEHLACFSVWPALFMPDEPPLVNNRVYAGPMFKPAYPRF